MGGRSTFAIIAAAACAVTPAQASAWARGDGRLFVATKLEYFTAETGLQSIFSRIDNSTYAEYGLFPRTAIGAKVNYGTSWTNDPNGAATASGFTEIEAFAQRRLWRGRNDVVSLRLGAIAPARAGSGVRNSIATNGVDVELRALYGRNIALRPVKLFVSAEAGFRKNLGDGADEIRADLTIGAEPSKRLLLLLESFSTVSARNETNGGSDYDIYKAQASVVWRASRRFRLQAGYNRELEGRNVALGETYVFGFWSEF